ncbi:MAG: DUF4838 domain-containing protein [Clostridia bacterium]|nr:DUF4838 domain-containing protein [Clostridia bacterium]
MSSKGIIIHDTDISAYWEKLFLQSGLDTLGIHPAGGVDAHLTLEKFLFAQNDPTVFGFIDRLSSKGVRIELECHALSWLLPREMFAKNPHWFRVNENGERTADFNMCPSCGEALEYLAERTHRFAALISWNSSYFHLWIDDVASAPCMCEKCKSLSPSDQAMIIYNAMLKGLKAYRSDARLAYLAYHGTIDAPSVKPEEGIFLEFAPIRRCFEHSINDESCQKNVAEIASLDSLLAFFGKRDSKVLEYWMDNSLFSGWKKPFVKLPFNRDILEKDVEFYRAKGFERITSFGCFLNEEYASEYGIPPVKEYAEAILKQNI